MRNYLIKILFVAVGAFSFSCATFYELNYEFNQQFESGNMELAEKALARNSKRISRKAEFLYLVNRGVISFMQGAHIESNEWFEKAYLFTEDYQKNYANVAASFLINPNMIEYPGEDHERLYILYYKALNFCYLGDYESALVECRRLNNRLYSLSDKYRSENKFRADAFIHNLMGIVYEANGEYNNAFIAYENALKIYENSYSEMFGLDAPSQLKKDLMRSAYLVGFRDKLRFYERKFGTEYQHTVRPAGGELIFFWHNGLAPVKDEWSVNFTITGRDDFVTFANDEYGLNFTFPYSSDRSDESASITDLRFFRVTFPKYIDRPPSFNSAKIEIGGSTHRLELAEDVADVARKTLQQRMVAEMSKSLLRAALKKLAEQEVRKENEGLGFVLGVVNAATEKADTRNWQTLPNSIYYTRVPLQSGENVVRLKMSNDRFGRTEKFTFQGVTGKTQFQAYQTLN